MLLASFFFCQAPSFLIVTVEDMFMNAYVTPLYHNCNNAHGNYWYYKYKANTS